MRNVAPNDTETTCTSLVVVPEPELDGSWRALPEVVRAEDVFSAAILTAWSRSIESIVEVGRLLIQAKHELVHGVFILMVRDRLPFSVKSAQRIMKIAMNPAISENATHGSLLPTSWRSLAEIARWEPMEIEYALSKGILQADTPRNRLKLVRTQARKSLRAGGTLADPVEERNPARALVAKGSCWDRYRRVNLGRAGCAEVNALSDSEEVGYRKCLEAAHRAYMSEIKRENR